MSSSRLALLAGAATVVAAVFGCGLALEGLGPAVPGDDGGPTGDGGGVTADVAGEAEGAAQDDGGGLDAADAPAPGDGGFPTVTLASVGAIASATGRAQQTHLLWANHSGRWWLFWLDPAQPQQLQASWSSDFATWTQAAPLALPGSHFNEAGNFSVAYADVGGVDVVHVTLSLHYAAANDRRHLHARATIVGAAISYGPPGELSKVNDPAFADPDGPATFVASDGTVWDATGWAAPGPGDESAWASASPDVGGSWDGTFGLEQDLGTASNPVSARTFASAPGGALLALWDLGDFQPNPTRVAWTLYVSGTTWIPQNVMFLANVQGANDWDAIPVGPNDVRLVRRALDGTFDHGRFNGAWASLPSPPSEQGLAGSGVVLLSDGTRVGVVAIAGDAAASVRMVVWDGTAWGAWSTLEGSTAGRGFLSGWSSPGHAAVIWTRAAGSSFVIEGRQVSLK